MNRIHHRIRYPKLLLLLATIIVAAVLFQESKDYGPLHDFLMSLGYIGTFLGGIFYAYGFTAAPATAVLLVLAKEQCLVLAVLVGGLGAVLSDLLIFSFIRYSFMDEIEELEKEKIVKYIEKEEKIIFGHYYKHIFPALAGFLIASPLPTELGVVMMTSVKEISLKKFTIIAYLLHCLGILAILAIGNLI
ncbi:MAG: hypothetical protein JW778_06765 [Candidatus Altiarchaeota archaeon]|nr:hypothetical protein [Candidatus Altiarchaeota archaeon]